MDADAEEPAGDDLPVFFEPLITWEMTASWVVGNGRQRDRWRDNVFVERLWKSVKYQEVYLHAYDTVSAVRAGLACYVQFHSTRRPHTALDRRTPDDVYFESLPLERAA